MFVVKAKLETTTAAAATVARKRDIGPSQVRFDKGRGKEGLGAGRAEQEWRAPQRARDERDRNVGRRPARGPRKTRPREDEKAHGNSQRREGRLHRQLLPAVVQLLKVHQKNGKAICGEHGVVKRRRARWV